MPRISQQQKDLNRQRIIASASERFRERGVAGVGIDHVMQAAGMTHGGFYNHFASKEELALEVLSQSFAHSLQEVDSIVAHAPSAHAGLQAIIDHYLSVDHRDHPERGCPSATLVVDVSRDGAASQLAYQNGLEGYLSAISDLLLAAAESDGESIEADDARRHAMALFSQMVGAQLLARAVAKSDRALADELLTANATHMAI